MTTTIVALIFLGGAAVLANKIESQDNTEIPTRAQLLAEIRPFQNAFDISSPHYFDRSSLIGVTARSNRKITKSSLFGTANTNGWKNAQEQFGAYFRQYSFCKDRLSLNIEQGLAPESYIIISVRWTSDPDSPAYCSHKTSHQVRHD